MQTVANAYSDAGDAFHCGVREGGVRAWRVAYTEHEFCHLLAARVLVRGGDGSETMAVAGDSFVIPAGFETPGKCWNPRASFMRPMSLRSDESRVARLE